MQDSCPVHHCSSVRDHHSVPHCCSVQNCHSVLHCCSAQSCCCLLLLQLLELPAEASVGCTGVTLGKLSER